MGFAKELISKLFIKKRTRLKPEAEKNNDDPANLLYETFEHGYKHEEEKGFGICQMKHNNEL